MLPSMPCYGSQAYPQVPGIETVFSGQEIQSEIQSCPVGEDSRFSKVENEIEIDLYQLQDDNKVVYAVSEAIYLMPSFKFDQTVKKGVNLNIYAKPTTSWKIECELEGNSV